MEMEVRNNKESQSFSYNKTISNRMEVKHVEQKSLFNKMYIIIKL